MSAQLKDLSIVVVPSPHSKSERNHDLNGEDGYFPVGHIMSAGVEYSAVYNDDE